MLRAIVYIAREALTQKYWRGKGDDIGRLEPGIEIIELFGHPSGGEISSSKFDLS